jgi:hypothetical protein
VSITVLRSLTCVLQLHRATVTPLTSLRFRSSAARPVSSRCPVHGRCPFAARSVFLWSVPVTLDKVTTKIYNDQITTYGSSTVVFGHAMRDAWRATTVTCAQPQPARHTQRLGAPTTRLLLWWRMPAGWASPPGPLALPMGAVERQWCTQCLHVERLLPAACPYCVRAMCSSMSLRRALRFATRDTHTNA